MLNIDTRTADKKTTYSTFCRAIAIRAVHPHSWKRIFSARTVASTTILQMRG
jgi:hypothetical protein